MKTRSIKAKKIFIQLIKQQLKLYQNSIANKSVLFFNETTL